MIAVRDFLGAYEESRKEPDLMIRPGNQLHPSTVVEVGCSESYPHLERDMRLWFDGTRAVNVVLVIEWSRPSSKVRGSVEAWVRGANGTPMKRQSSVCVSLLVVFQHHTDGGYVRSSFQYEKTNPTLLSHAENYLDQSYRLIWTLMTS